MDNEWMASGLCRVEPPSRFFPSDGVGVEIAKRICAELENVVSYSDIVASQHPAPDGKQDLLRGGRGTARFRGKL